MPVRPLRQKPKVATFRVRARLGHPWSVDPDGTPHPGPRVTHHGRFAQGKGVRAYVGYVFDKALAIPGESEGGWRPTVEAEEIPRDAEYLQAIAHGDLWPADEETARAVCGYAVAQGLAPVKFDPTYGGELKELTDWLAEVQGEEARVDAEAARIANAKPQPTQAALKPSLPPALLATPAASSTPEGKV